MVSHWAGGGGGEKVEEGEFEVAAGDTVRIDLDLESVKIMQEDHGGWIEPMNSVSNVFSSSVYTMYIYPKEFSTYVPVSVGFVYNRP